jgi:branched-chain amino acid transport system ATP-binding protein
VLEANHLVVDYGTVRALQGISLRVERGEMVSVIGSNGAGKTTALIAMMGLIVPVSGQILFKGMDITGWATHRIVHSGLGIVLEGRQLFGDQSVEDNLLLGIYFKKGKDKKAIKERVEREYQRFPVLEERRRQLAGTLSGGEQQMLSISRALISDPELLLMDEPTMGLAPIMVQTIVNVIRSLKKEGRTILLVEQMAMIALHISDRAYIMETGRISLEGEGKALLKDSNVKKAYLGE